MVETFREKSPNMSISTKRGIQMILMKDIEGGERKGKCTKPDKINPPKNPRTFQQTLKYKFQVSWRRPRKKITIFK